MIHTISTNTFDGSKVNGLANTIDNKIDAIETDDALDSTSLFKFLKDDENYNLVKQMNEMALTFEWNGNEFSALKNGGTKIIGLTVPGYAYDAENKTWNETKSSIRIPAMLAINIDTMTATVAIGQYACDMSFAMSSDVESGDTTIENFSNPSWRRPVFA